MAKTWFGVSVCPLLLRVGVATRSDSTFAPTHLVRILSAVPACTPAPTQPIYLQHERLQLLHNSLPGCCLIYCGPKGSVRKNPCFDLESCHRPVSRLLTSPPAAPLSASLDGPLDISICAVTPLFFFSNNIKPWKLGFCLCVLHLGCEVCLLTGLRLQSVALVLTRCSTTVSSHQVFWDWMLGL